MRFSSTTYRRLFPLVALVLTANCSGVPATDQVPVVASYELSKNPAVLDILTYNVFLRSPTYLFRDRQRERAAALPSQLQNYDVIVFQEAFDDRLRAALLKSLEPQYPFHTRILGRNGIVTEDGGVLIVSRWPIEREDQFLFGKTCAGLDCMASKGVVFARIRKRDQVYNVFGLHCQNGDTRRSVRARQIDLVSAFVARQHLSSVEPVIIAGDFNINMLSDSVDGEYSAMTRTLDVTHPEPRPGPARVPSYNSATNRLANETLIAYVDYILIANAHRRPVRAFTEVLMLKADGKDLSDHYAVHARLEFGTE